MLSTHNPNSDTTITKDDLIKQFSNGSVVKLSIDRMAIIIKAFQKDVAKKDVKFKCYVFSSKEWEIPTAYVDFLKTLEENKKKCTNDIRIQYVFLNNNDHWTTGDIFVSNNHLSFFLVDAANKTEGLAKQIEFIQQICSPPTNIMACALNIQKARENCGYFSARLAKNLSEISELHLNLKKAKNPDFYCITNISEWILRNTFKDDVNPVRYIAREALLQLDGFGSLFKNSQDPINTQGIMCRNNKPLDFTFKRYQIQFQKENEISIRNPRIYAKRKNMVESSQRLLASITEEECQEIINNKDGKKFLSELETKKSNQVITTIPIEEKTVIVEPSQAVRNALTPLTPRHFLTQNPYCHFNRFHHRIVPHLAVQPALQPDKPTYTIHQSYFK